MNKGFRIVAPHFVAGADLQTGRYAPIIKYMAGWDRARVERYCAAKKWRLEWL